MRSAMRTTSLLAATLLLAASSVSMISPAHAGPSSAGPIAKTRRPLVGLDAELDALFVSGGLTADAAARRARTASPQVKAATAGIYGAAAREGKAQIDRIPKLTLTAGYTRLSDVETQPITFGGTTFAFPVILDNWSSSAELRVPVSDHILRFPHAIAAAEHGVAAAKLTAAGTVEDAALDARLAYHEWVRARLQVIVAERLVAQIQANLAQVLTRAAAEDATRADVARLQAQAAEAAQDVLTLRNLAAQRELILRRTIDAADTEALTIGEDVREDAGGGVPGDAASWVAHARNARPEIKAIDARIAAAASNKKLAAAGRLPRLDAFARLDYDNPNSRAIPADDQFEMTWAAGATVSWSLDGALAAKPQMIEQDAEMMRLAAEREATADQNEIAVMDAVRAIEVAQLSHITTDEGLAAAEENYRVRRALFNAGRATSVELTDAETELTRARIAAVDARVDLRIGIARLHHAIGL
jgi:outer membrane protein TolC